MRGLKSFGVASGLAAVVLVGAVASVGAEGVADAIATRQAIMKSNAAHMGGIKAAAMAGNAKAVAAHAGAINAMAKVVGNYFPPGSGSESGVKTQALPAIWSDWKGFAGKAGTLATESAKLVEVAKSGGDTGALMAQFGAPGKQAYGGCHQTYRQKQK